MNVRGSKTWVWFHSTVWLLLDTHTLGRQEGENGNQDVTVQQNIGEVSWRPECLCPLAPIAQSPDTPRNFRNIPVPPEVGLLCSDNKGLGEGAFWLWEWSERDTFLSCLHGCPFLFPNVPIFSQNLITSYLFLWKAIQLFSLLLVSPHKSILHISVFMPLSN